MCGGVDGVHLRDAGGGQRQADGGAPGGRPQTGRPAHTLHDSFTLGVGGGGALHRGGLRLVLLVLKILSLLSPYLHTPTPTPTHTQVSATAGASARKNTQYFRLSLRHTTPTSLSFSGMDFHTSASLLLSSPNTGYTNAEKGVQCFFVFKTVVPPPSVRVYLNPQLMAVLTEAGLLCVDVDAVLLTEHLIGCRVLLLWLRGTAKEEDEDDDDSLS